MNIESESACILNCRNKSVLRKRLLLLVVLFIMAATTSCTQNSPISQTYEEQLIGCKTEYVGDNSKVGGIISLLEFPQTVKYRSFELYTDESMRAVTVYFDTDTETRDYYTGALLQRPFKTNAIIMYSLIGNVDYINFILDDNKNDYLIQYTRDEANDTMGQDVREFTDSPEELAEFIQNISTTLDEIYID